MNNRKTATISPVITNLENLEKRPQLKLNLIPTEEIPEKEQKTLHLVTHDLSVGDWVKNSAGRPGQITDYREVKPGCSKVWVKWSGDNHSTSGDRDSLTRIYDPKDKEWSIESEILKYLEKEKDFVHEVAIAAELEIGVPVARKYLRDLGNRVKNDGDRSWRIARPSDIDTDEVKEKRTINVDVECSHSWEFSPSPVKLGFVERCNNCGAVKSIQGSEKLSELILWLSKLVQDFETQAKKTFDEREQAYYLDCANNKQQLIKQVERHLALAREEESGELLVNNSVTSELENEESTEEKDKQFAKSLKAEILKLISEFFVTLGEKLKIYQEKKLYRFEAQTFGEWCEQEIGIKRNYAYKMIRAFDIYTYIQKQMCTDCTQNQNIPLPKSEYQVRALARLSEEQWYPTWVEAIEQSKNKSKPPSGKLVERIVKERQRMEKQTRYQPQIDRFKPGDVVRITASHNPDLKEYHSCWGQVVSLEEHSYTVLTWKGEISYVAHDDLMLLKQEFTDAASNLLSQLNRLRIAWKNDPDVEALLHYFGTKPLAPPSVGGTLILDSLEKN